MGLRILDLFCCAGGASAGYQRYFPDAQIVGVDINPMPDYPFEFLQADAMTFPLSGFDLIHASPPCQRFSTMTKRWGREDEHPDLVAATRERLRASGAAYVIENVPAAPLLNAVTLCGSMFGLELRRHRQFETSFPMRQPKCDHASQTRVVGVYGHPGGSSKRDGIKFASFEEWKVAMGIDWMKVPELAEALPPAYTFFVAEAFDDWRNRDDEGRVDQLIREPAQVPLLVPTLGVQIPLFV